MNRVLLKQSDGTVFLTLLYGVLDLTTGDFEFSVGGQPPPYVCSPDRRGIFLREPTGTMLGLLSEAVYETRTVRIAPGEALVFYTDGVTEAENDQEAFFTEDRLAEILECCKNQSAGDIATKIVDALSSFAAGYEQTDDITILAVRFKSPAS
jgi:sigma-B regulation protein RsbU (phosphoserine phosphatase)